MFMYLCIYKNYEHKFYVYITESDFQHSKLQQNQVLVQRRYDPYCEI